MTKVAGKGAILRIVAATSRDRVFLVAALYYIVYENLAALTSFEAGLRTWILEVVFAFGGALLAADKAVESNLRALLTSSVEPVGITVPVLGREISLASYYIGELAAVIAMAGALSTIVIYFRAAKYVMQAKNPNIGFDEAIFWPLALYTLAVVAVSAVQGTVRIPFQGVLLLLQNLDVVAAGFPFGESGNVSQNFSEGVSFPDFTGRINESANQSVR